MDLMVQLILMGFIHRMLLPGRTGPETGYHRARSMLASLAQRIVTNEDLVRMEKKRQI
jgi:hypothetical protein